MFLLPVTCWTFRGALSTPAPNFFEQLRLPQFRTLPRNHKKSVVCFWRTLRLFDLRFSEYPFLPEFQNTSSNLCFMYSGYLLGTLLFAPLNAIIDYFFKHLLAINPSIHFPILFKVFFWSIFTLQYYITLKSHERWPVSVSTLYCQRSLLFQIITSVQKFSQLADRFHVPE